MKYISMKQQHIKDLIFIFIFTIFLLLTSRPSEFPNYKKIQSFNFIFFIFSQKLYFNYISKFIFIIIY